MLPRHTILLPRQTWLSLANRLARQLCIMDREEEFSVNAKSASSTHSFVSWTHYSVA